MVHGVLGPAGKRNLVVAAAVRRGTYLPSDYIMCLVTPGGLGM